MKKTVSWIQTKTIQVRPWQSASNRMSVPVTRKWRLVQLVSPLDLSFYDLTYTLQLKQYNHNNIYIGKNTSQAFFLNFYQFHGVFVIRDGTCYSGVQFCAWSFGRIVEEVKKNHFFSNGIVRFERQKKIRAIYIFK